MVAWDRRTHFSFRQMQTTTLVLILTAMAASAFYMGRRRSLALVGGPRNILGLHSLPGYYGYYTAIWCLLPALGLLLLWLAVEPRVIVALIVQSLPDAERSMAPGELNLLINNIRNLAVGDSVSGDISSMLTEASARLQESPRETAPR